MLNEIHLFLKTILSETKFEGKTYFVGGCVRDHFRGTKAHDIDIVVDMKDGAKELSHFIYDYFKAKMGKHLLDDFITIPYQLGHYPIYSITFKSNVSTPGYFYKFKNITIEIADTMNETFPDDNSRQRDVIYGTLTGDIMRRDFSINSGLIDVVSFEFKDLTPDKTILNDIGKSIIRCNMDTSWYINKIFSNDPLRILRGVVFAARFNFTIDPFVKDRMIENIDRLKIVSRERINAEIKKAFDVQSGAYRLVKLLDEINGLEIVFPGIKKLKEIYQVNMNEDGTFTYDIRNIHMEGKTVFDHTMAVLKFVKKGYVNGLAAVYHDVGKIRPEYKNGKVRFLNHEFIGRKIVRDLFPVLKIDSETSKAVIFLIENHMKLHMMKDLSKKSLRRFIREIPSNELRFALYDLCNADCLGTVQKVDGIICSGTPHYEAMELIENLIKEDSIIVEKPFRYFNGNEIMEMLNISGPDVGIALNIMMGIQDEYGFKMDKEFIKEELIKRFFKKKGIKRHANK
jgi:poly(A) polymerase